MEPLGGKAHEEYWKEKYLQMEAKMSQFHMQASEIRSKLAVKIRTLASECDSATARAEKAEEEVRKLAEQVELTKKEKDREIRRLQEELKHEKEMAVKKDKSWKAEIEARNEERALVHQKIARLKVWISAKLEEMEDQKKLLFEANERATTSLFEMKRRVQELVAELNELKKSAQASLEQKHSRAQEDTSLELSMTITSPLQDLHSMEICSSPPPVPPHSDKAIKHFSRTGMGSSTLKDIVPSPLLLDDPSTRRDTSSGTTSTTITISSVEDCKNDSKQSLKTARTKTEIIIDNESNHHSSFMKQELIIDSKKKKKSATLPKTRSGTKKEHSTTHHHSSLIETFGSITRKFRGFTDSHQSSPNRGIRRTQSAGKKEGKLDSTRGGSKKHVSTPQIGKDLSKIKTRSSGKTKRLCDTLEEEEDNLVIVPEKMEVPHNNSTPASTYLSSSLPSPLLSSMLPRTKRSQSMRTPRRNPPAPPMHQVPIWETKIYSLAKTGFQHRGSDLLKPAIHDTQVPIRYHSSVETTTSIYKRQLQSVPVYTKLFGKIILLRKMPFSDHSEWSDDDDMAGTVVSEVRNLRSMALHDASVTISLRRNGSPVQARAVKRANSSHSITSSEGDYSIPPDAISLCSDSSEPEHKLYKTRRNGAPAAASNRVNSSSSSSGASPETGTSPLLSPAGMLQPASLVQEKCGFLFKLGSYSLTWRKRFFVLKSNRLQYFFSPNDANQKQPVYEIALNGETNLYFEHFDDSLPIFELTTPKKTLYITADSAYAADDWIRALNTTLNRPRTLGLSKTRRHRGSIVQNEIVLQGWLERSSKDGNKRKLWACLGSSSLYFYADHNEQEFVGRIRLKECKISPLTEDNVICIKFPVHSGQQRQDVLLTLSSKMEKDAWLYYLTVASGSLFLSLSCTTSQNYDASIGTAYERFLTRIMYVAMCASDNKDDSIAVAAASPLWRNQTLSFSRHDSFFSLPLTTLSSETLHKEAVTLKKLCQQFTNSEIDSTSVDFHVTIAQTVASLCLAHCQLQGEIYAQLIKQCNGKFVKQASMVSPKHSASKMKMSTKTTDETAVLQAWKLLSLIIPLFIPHKRLLWLLEAHLHRHANDKSEIGQYAIYCQRVLTRAVSCGGRTSPPSRTETVSILRNNPYRHSLPFSMPVHFDNGKYQVMSFDASTTVAEFTQYICQQSGIRLPSISGFALFTDDPVDASTVDHYVSGSFKVCDIISEWERAYRETAPNKIIDASRMVKVTLSQHLTFATSRECETEKEKFLIAYQVSSKMTSDRFPVTRELAIELAALCAQMDGGDMRSTDQAIKGVLEKFYPKRYLESASKQQIRQLRGKLCEKWSLLKSSPVECARVFLSAVRKCPIYGARLFRVEKCLRHGKGTVIWLAIHEQGVDELNYATMESEQKFFFMNIMTYGGSGDGLVIVDNGDGIVKKHFYSVEIDKAAEIVHLMTEYVPATMAMKD